jgi:hypothetical protein
MMGPKYSNEIFKIGIMRDNIEKAEPNYWTSLGIKELVKRHKTVLI